MVIYTDRTTFDRDLVAVLPELRKHAIARLRNVEQADDLVSRTTIRALECWHQFEPGTYLRAWLYRIMFNEMVNEYRRYKRRALVSLDHQGEQYLEPFIATPARGDDIVLTGEILGHISDMGPARRELLMDIVVRGLSYNETCEHLGIRINSLKSRLWRARTALRQRIGADDGQ